MQFHVNHSVSGFRGGSLAKGDVIDASLLEVTALVACKYGGEVFEAAQAALTPVAGKEVAPHIPGHHVNLSRLSREELLDHARRHHSMTLWANQPLEAILLRIETARTKELAAYNG